MLTRRLKVYETANNRKDPCIILQGKWIDNIGFKKGERVDIQYDQGHINIVLIKESQLSIIPDKVKKRDTGMISR